MKHLAEKLFLAALTLAWCHVVDAEGMVVLLTDYGADSIYVGVLKGAIYAKCPEARVDSLTHSVPPFDIAAGACLLAEACREFPANTIFCCVVDPGVGTTRKAIVLETERGQRFVAPDNGLLTMVAERDGVRQIREASNRDFWRAGVQSSTFHGRDLFGPVAGALACGAPLDEVGPPLTEVVRLELPSARVEGGAARGQVIRVDIYGNIISNIRMDNLEALGVKRGDRLEVEIGAARFDAPLVNTYADVAEGEKLALVQSLGLVEFAVNLGNLAEALGEGLHAPVAVRKMP